MLKKWMVLCAVAFGGISAVAQVAPARFGGLPETNIGVSFSDFSPDYTLKRLYGFGAYANVIPLHYHRIDIGLEGELKVLSLNQVVHVHERSLSVGPIVSVPRYYGFKPYAKVMYGLGNFYYPYFTSVRPSFYTDSFGIWVLGAGADHHLVGKFSIRGDYEYQKWTHFRGGGKELNPNGFTVGVHYRLF